MGAIDAEGRTALHWVCQCRSSADFGKRALGIGAVSAVRALLAAGADARARDAAGESPLEVLLRTAEESRLAAVAVREAYDLAVRRAYDREVLDAGKYVQAFDLRGNPVPEEVLAAKNRERLERTAAGDRAQDDARAAQSAADVEAMRQILCAAAETAHRK